MNRDGEENPWKTLSKRMVLYESGEIDKKRSKIIVMWTTEE